MLVFSLTWSGAPPSPSSSPSLFLQLVERTLCPAGALHVTESKVLSWPAWPSMVLLPLSRLSLTASLLFLGSLSTLLA